MRIVWYDVKSDKNEVEEGWTLLKRKKLSSARHVLFEDGFYTFVTSYDLYLQDKFYVITI